MCWGKGDSYCEQLQRSSSLGLSDALSYWGGWGGRESSGGRLTPTPPCFLCAATIPTPPHSSQLPEPSLHQRSGLTSCPPPQQPWEARTITVLPRQERRLGEVKRLARRHHQGGGPSPPRGGGGCPGSPTPPSRGLATPPASSGLSGKPAEAGESRRERPEPGGAGSEIEDPPQAPPPSADPAPPPPGPRGWRGSGVPG